MKKRQLHRHISEASPCISLFTVRASLENPGSRIVTGRFSKTDSWPMLQLHQRGTRTAFARRHITRRAHVRTLSRVADTLVLIAIYVSLQSSSVRGDKGSCAAGGRFYILKRFKRETCHYRSRQKTPCGYHASHRRLRESRRVALINLGKFVVHGSYFK